MIEINWLEVLKVGFDILPVHFPALRLIKHLIVILAGFPKAFSTHHSGKKAIVGYNGSCQSRVRAVWAFEKPIARAPGRRIVEANLFPASFPTSADLSYKGFF